MSQSKPDNVRHVRLCAQPWRGVLKASTSGLPHRRALYGMCDPATAKARSRRDRAATHLVTHRSRRRRCSRRGNHASAGTPRPLPSRRQKIKTIQTQTAVRTARKNSPMPKLKPWTLTDRQQTAAWLDLGIMTPGTPAHRRQVLHNHAPHQSTPPLLRSTEEREREERKKTNATFTQLETWWGSVQAFAVPGTSLTSGL